VLKNYYFPLLLVIYSLLYAGQVAAASEQEEKVVIGVLAYNGERQALARWSPTADYLAKHIGHQFEILPLTHADFVHAINKGRLDFILTNPGHYILLEVNYGATRIATFKSRFESQVLTHFSTVIFTRRDSGLQKLGDLKGHSLAAVSNDAFGGFQLAEGEFLGQQLNIYEDISLKWLGFPHADIVRAVIAGRVDAGTVRTGVLEKMAAKGEINLSELLVLNERITPGFPLLHSAGLYPEWPIARLPATDARLAKQVAITLLQMPQNARPALASGGSGWTIPLDYLKVHELFRRLQIAPYSPVPLALKDFWQSYRGWVFLLALVFLVCILVILYTLKINRELKRSQEAISNHREQLEQGIRERTAELSEVNRALQQDIESRIQSENTLHEGCEILQTLYTVTGRNDLSRHQRLQSIVDLARQYLGAEVGALSIFDGGSYRMTTFSPGNEETPVPLSPEHAVQAMESSQIVYFQGDDGQWRSYLACSCLIADKRFVLLEFASPHHDSHEVSGYVGAGASELGLRILHLITQWVSNELTQLESENDLNDKQHQARSCFTGITSREREVLQLVADGESNKSIARLLDISIKTVELHRANLIRKTGASSSIQLVKLATAANLVD